MPAKKTLEEVIQSFVKIHNYKYDYSIVEYINGQKKVKIVCPAHGVFEQTPMGHLAGNGCKKCVNKRLSKSRRNTTKNFIEKATIKHSGYYSYDITEYTTLHEKLTITCPLHGEFQQRAFSHLKGSRCPKCSIKKTFTTEEFIEKAKEVHGDKYDYTDSIYIGYDNNVPIICRLHGKFNQRAGSHITGAECPLCIKERGSFSKKDYVEKSKDRATILYLIECYNSEERFYKIGKTFNNVNTRYKAGAIPYSFNVIHIYTKNAETIYDLEIELHAKYRGFKYSPKISFAGYTECYNLSLPIEDIKSMN